MSDIFCEELDIPRPDYYLGVGSGSDARQTADIFVKVKEILQQEKPDYLLVYGDTNSIFVAALAASILLIQVVHSILSHRYSSRELEKKSNFKCISGWRCYV